MSGLAEANEPTARQPQTPSRRAGLAFDCCLRVRKGSPAGLRNMNPTLSVSGGLPWTESRLAGGLFAGLPAHCDVLQEWLSSGQNGRWRRAMVEHVVSA